jgi:small subunit ribosomal protein S8
MSMTDPVADLLTRIRNANRNGAKSVTVPYSGLKNRILNVMKDQGYITDFAPELDDRKGILAIQLKYGPDGERVIQHIQRVSKPGRRVFCGVTQLPEVLDGLGIAIVSTSRGVMSNGQAKKLGVGGEVLCEVW